MADYLNKVNTFLIYIFLLLLCIVIRVKSKEEYIPALIWTSKEYQERKSVDYLVIKKITSDLFDFYLKELLNGQKPLIVVFIENDLGNDDLEWENKTVENYPFLSNLKKYSRVDYFRSVKSPYQIVVHLSKEYNTMHYKPGNEFNYQEKDLVFVEFQKIISDRSGAMRDHDHQIEKIHQKLMKSGRSWICIYTAKKYNSNECNLKPLNYLFSEELQNNSITTVSLSRDELTGLMLMTNGSIQLNLPTQESSTIKILEKYLGTSVKSSQHKIDFVIWFFNYTLTFHLNETKDQWKIEEPKLLNPNGHILVLTLVQEEFHQENCYIETTEIKSEGKPLVKIILFKYKFVELQLHEKPCSTSYGFHMTFSIIFLSLVIAVMCWKKMIDKFDFSANASIIRIPTESILAISSKKAL